MIQKNHIADAPATIGVYIFKKSDEILYIGKSINIKSRLRSHLEDAKISRKAASYVNEATNVEYHATDSEFKALLLESQLIQKHHPKYNVRWKDDKSYLYIKINPKEEYPKVEITRRENEKDAEYFGPFPSIRLTELILKEIRRVFPFCMKKRIGKRRCFYAKIGLCKPCPSYIVSIKDEDTKKKLSKEYTQNLQNVRKVLKGDVDKVHKQLYEKVQQYSNSQDYEKALEYRNRAQRLERAISKRAFSRGDSMSFNSSEKRIKELKTLLNRHNYQITTLHRIECYDMSTLQFTDSTASMVVFTDGLADKSQYKRFKIKDTKADSDFAMFQEVMQRRFKHTDWGDPDLIVVDGGKPQVRIVKHVFQTLGVEVPLIGIAKRPDRIVTTNDAFSTIRTKRNNEGLKLLQALRDESHRFAKKYHRYLRAQRMV